MTDNRPGRFTTVLVHWAPLLAVINLVLLIVVAVVSVAALKLANRLDEQQVARDAAIYGACERLQRVRDDVNIQAAGQYLVIKGAASSPGIPSKLAAFYRMIAEDTPYSPPTDCNDAVKRPLTYRAPALVPFDAVAGCFAARRPRVDPAKCDRAAPSLTQKP